MSTKKNIDSKLEEEKRRKIELRSAIDQIEAFLEKLKHVSTPDLPKSEIDEGIKNLKKIIKAVRGYHAGVSGLLSSFEVLYKNLEDLKTVK